MKILFVATNRLKRVMPPMPLGLASVIAQIDESRHEFKVLDLMFSEDPQADLKAALSELEPDLIAVSVRNVDNQSYLDTEYLLPEAKVLMDSCRKNSDAKIVLGGPAFTVSPIAIFEYLEPDFGIAGEGEIAFRELVARIDTGADYSDVAGLVWRDGGETRMNPPVHITDLDSLQLPRRDLFDNQRYIEAGGFGNMVVKQGCSFRCLYCDSPHAMGKQWRMKSPEKVVEEMLSMQELGINVAFFTDSVFNFPAGYAKSVCREIIKRKPGLFWVGMLTPKSVDKELLELMKDAGCNAVSLGCDTCSEKMLKALRKDFTKEELLKTAELLEEVELNYILSLLIGGPGEDRETVEESIAFAEQRNPFMLDFCVGIRLMPGTGLVDIAIEEGVISADDPLMEPKFYVDPNVKDWVADYLREVCAGHPNWTVAHEE